jgi:predicted dithiol-disulfide oxidoreductase (DUF899 family)
MDLQRIVSPQEWVLARKQLLEKEKELTRMRDELSRRRRELPWEKVEKRYVFEGPDGQESLADLFDGRSQLAVYHFMLGPDWPEGCPSCSMAADHFDRSRVHLAQRDVTLVAVSRAGVEKIEAFRKRMGWSFQWVSSAGNGFNRDYRVSFTPDEMAAGKVHYNYGLQAFPSEEAPGLSLFARNAAGEVFHTYSAYARGLEDLLGVYTVLDFAPKGRDEADLPHPMAWVRHHDRYEEAPVHACCAGAKSA